MGSAPHEQGQASEPTGQQANQHDEDIAGDAALQKDPRATSHPTGQEQAAENTENDPVA